MKSIKGPLLVAIEGVDGSGKSSLARALEVMLKKYWSKVILTKEPGGTILGEKIRSLLLHRDCVIDAKAEFLLFAASRAQHFDELIIPYLNNQYIVISDRMADSSLVYQGYGRGLSIPVLKEINAWAMHTRKPDITFYLKLSFNQALERIKNRALPLTSFEMESDLLKKSITGFDELYKDASGVVILDATFSQEMLCQKAFEAILEFF